MGTASEDDWQGAGEVNERRSRGWMARGQGFDGPAQGAAGCATKPEHSHNWTGYRRRAADRLIEITGLGRSAESFASASDELSITSWAGGLKTMEAQMKVTSLGQMANHTAKHFYRMNRAIVDALVSAGKIAADQADKEWARRVADDLVRNGMKVSKAIAALLR
jgi:hypothetical protein